MRHVSRSTGWGCRIQTHVRQRKRSRSRCWHSNAPRDVSADDCGWLSLCLFFIGDFPDSCKDNVRPRRFCGYAAARRYSRSLERPYLFHAANPGVATPIKVLPCTHKPHLASVGCVLARTAFWTNTAPPCIPTSYVRSRTLPSGCDGGNKSVHLYSCHELQLQVSRCTGGAYGRLTGSIGITIACCTRLVS